MNDHVDFERTVAGHIASEGVAPPSETFYEELFTRAGRSRQRPEWLALIKEPPMRTNSHLSVGSPTARVAAVVAATFLLAVALAAAGVAGSRLLAADSAIVVDQSGDGTVTTITEALAMAADGDTILVRPGTYTEAVTIDKDITLRGDGPREGIVLIAPAAGPTWPVEGTFFEDPYAILVHEADATISGLTFSGTASEVILHGGSPTLEDSAFAMVGATFDGSTSSPGGSSVVVTGGSHALVSGNSITGGGPIGVFDASAPRLDANILSGGPHIYLKSVAPGSEITNNMIEGTLRYAINTHSDGVDILDNQISDPGQVGIRVRNGMARVEGNSISDAATGISVAGGTAEVIDNVLVHNELGIGGSVITLVRGNAVRDGKAGIALTTGQVLVEDNVVEGNSVSGISIGSAASPILRGNAVCGNGENLSLSDDSEPQIDATNEICEDAPVE